MPQPQASQIQPANLEALESVLIKSRVTIGPISLDVEDSADKLTLLVTKIVESFIARNIITTMSTGIGLISPVQEEPRKSVDDRTIR